MSEEVELAPAPGSWFEQITTINQIPVFCTRMTSFRRMQHYPCQTILQTLFDILDKNGAECWIWHIHSEEFGNEWDDRTIPWISLCSTVAEQYEHALLQIDVLRPTTYMHVQLAFLWPKLSTTMKSRIRITNIPRDSQYDIDDFT